MVVMHGHDTMDTRGSGSVLDQFNLLSRSGALGDIEALRKENRELDSLVTDASALVSLTDVPRMLDYVIARLLDRFIPEFLGFIMEPPRGDRVSQFCYRTLKPSDETIPLPSYRALKRHFLDKPYAARFDEVADDVLDRPLAKELEQFDIELLFPMRGIGGLYGIVLLGKKVVGDEYTDMERMYVDRMTRFLSIGIQNGFHHESSITDAKTGLYNHAFFKKRLEEEHARIMRSGGSAALLMLDVDHFKRFNDSYGHLAGDKALERLAACLREAMRDTDAVARFGGEEFCILVVQCDAAGAMDVAERVRANVEALRIQHESRILSITVSIGVRVMDAAMVGDAKSMLDDTDKALYAAKSAGRNCARLFKPGFLGRATLLRSSDGTPRPDNAR